MAGIARWDGSTVMAGIARGDRDGWTGPEMGLSDDDADPAVGGDDTAEISSGCLPDKKLMVALVMAVGNSVAMGIGCGRLRGNGEVPPVVGYNGGAFTSTPIIGEVDKPPNISGFG
jgi:hypothetical protein